MKQALNEALGIDINYRDFEKNLFCIAIASKAHVRKDIDKIFNKNKLVYMNCFKNSNIYKSPLSKTLLSDDSLYTEKVLGILEYGLENEDLSDIFDLYKKAHRRLYNGIKSIKNITIKDMSKYLSVGVEGNYEFIATMYIFSLNGIQILDENALNFTKVILDDFIQLSYYDKTNFSKKKVDEFSKELKELREYFGLEKRSYTGEDLISAILKKDTDRYNTSKTLIPWEMISPSDQHRIEKIGEVGKYIGAYEGLFKFLRINSADMMKRVSFTPLEVNTMLLNYLYSVIFNSFTENDRNIFLVSVIYFSSLNKVYSSLKDNYLKALNEDFLEEISVLQTSLEDSIYKAKKAEESFKEKEARFLNREKELLERINQLEKENKRLKQDIKEQEPLKQEVIKLRNIVFEDLSNNEEEIKFSEEVDLNELNKENVIIFGGNTTWVNNMKEKLPNAKFIGSEYINRKLDFVRKDSKIFINTKMPHAFYYKITDALYKTNAEYYYINNSSNINNSLTHMKEELNKEKK